MVRLYRNDEAAELLGISGRTLERWRVTGQGPQFTRLGDRVLYPEDKLEAFIAAGMRRSTSEQPGAVA